MSVKFSTDIHGAQRVSRKNCGDHLTFHLESLAAQNFHEYSEISHYLPTRLTQNSIL